MQKRQQQIGIIFGDGYLASANTYSHDKAPDTTAQISISSLTQGASNEAKASASFTLYLTPREIRELNAMLTKAACTVEQNIADFEAIKRSSDEPQKAAA